MRRFAAAFAAMLATCPGLVHAAQPCLTAAEASSLTAYALPSAITGTAKRCVPNLGTNAFLPTGGAELAARYAVRKHQNWPAAKAAFLKMGAKDESSAFLANMPDPSLQQMLDALIEGMVAQQIPLDRCAEIDRVVGLLAPLPAQNTAELLAVMFGLAGKTGKAKNDLFSICES
ncbi:hypothetical protein [Novosphingobium sp. M1R2S20]|uniref:YpeB-like protein with protease inhibitory function n=1 Tax=Novosphingobium rhizovicinum TaxID=3228928 RepID=A0ABV3RCK4_9SPHN